MRNLIPAWIRISGIMLILILITEYFIESGEQFAFIEYPILQLVLLIALLFLISAEVILNAVENTMFKTLSTEAKVRFLAEKQKREDKYSLKLWWAKMKYSQPEERDLELDHNYDGIKELDNKLPPWWLYSFYLTIIFAAGYMFYYHVLDGDDQKTEFEKEMAAAEAALEEYRRTAPDLINAENVVALTDPLEIEKGQSLYQLNCIACHASDGGGGIGPNLTDEYWILGGGIKNIYHTISEGGRAGKGMIAWKSTLSPTEMQQISSYVLTLVGTNPANPKEAEGDVWVEE